MKKFDNNCRICDSGEFKKEVHKNGYLYVSCSNCCTARLYPYPRKKTVKEIYENDYINLEKPELSSKKHYQIEYFSDYVRVMDLNFSDLDFNLKNIKSVFDIGCGIGLFLKYIKSKNLNIRSKGIDISSEMVKIAKSEDFDVVVGEVSLIDDKNKYDLITLWDVIEHLFDPVGDLRIVNSMLNHKGGVIIHTPCRGIISEQFGEMWPHYSPPEHIHLFNQEGLFSLLRECNFQITSWTRFGSGITRGKIPDDFKNIIDKICKKCGISDTLVVYATRSD